MNEFMTRVKPLCTDEPDLQQTLALMTRLAGQAEACGDPKLAIAGLLSACVCVARRAGLLPQAAAMLVNAGNAAREVQGASAALPSRMAGAGNARLAA